MLRVRNATELEAKWARELAKRAMQPWRHGSPVAGYVNEGRWVASCLECNGGMACWPEMSETQCLDCGARYTVEFPAPEELEQAAAVLRERPMRNRNWFPSRVTVGGVEQQRESVKDLKAENARHGVRF